MNSCYSITERDRSGRIGKFGALPAWLAASGMLVSRQRTCRMDTHDALASLANDLPSLSDQLLSAETCAAALDVSKSTWRAWVADPAFPVRPVRYDGRFTRFKRSQLTAWMPSGPFPCPAIAFLFASRVGERAPLDDLTRRCSPCASLWSLRTGRSPPRTPLRVVDGANLPKHFNTCERIVD